MRLINLLNFRKNPTQDGLIFENNNDFTCNFNKPLIIPKNATIKLLHAQINNSKLAEKTNLSERTDAEPPVIVNEQYTTRPIDLVYINLPDLPIQSYTGHSAGGKGTMNHIVGYTYTNLNENRNAQVAIKLNNADEIQITSMRVQILDTDYDLKVFGASNHRHSIMLAVSN